MKSSPMSPASRFMTGVFVLRQAVQGSAAGRGADSIPVAGVPRPTIESCGSVPHVGGCRAGRMSAVAGRGAVENGHPPAQSSRPAKTNRQRLLAGEPA
jgi:hypothetical protein